MAIKTGWVEDMDRGNEKEQKEHLEEMRPEWFTWFILTVCDPLVRRTKVQVLYNPHMDLEDHLIRVRSFPKDDEAWDELNEHVWRRYGLQKGMFRNAKSQEKQQICDDMFRSLRGFWTARTLEDGLYLLRQAGRLARKMMIANGPLKPDPIAYPEDVYNLLVQFDEQTESAV